MDSMDFHLNDMFHVDDNILDEYYNHSLNRFSVDLADNFKHYAIGESMQCQEIIAPVRSPYGHNHSPNNLLFDDDSSNDDSSLVDVPPPLIKRSPVDSDSDSDDDTALVFARLFHE